MKFHVRLIGEGTDKSPFRVPLPTYTMIEPPDEQNKCVLVEVPDSVLPDISFDHDLEAADTETVKGVIHKANPEYVGAVEEHLDNVYREHKGEYSLELVPLNG